MKVRRFSSAVVQVFVPVAASRRRLTLKAAARFS
jgi:hypothetical protein